MLNFTFQGKDYNVPVSPQDVRLGQYISYLQNIAPGEPTEVADYRALSAQLIALYDALDEYARKAGINTDTTEDAYLTALDAWVKSGSANNKAVRYLPPMITEARIKTDELSRLTEKMDNVWVSKYLLPYMGLVVSHFTGIDFAELQQHMDRKSLNYLFGLITKALAIPDSLEYAKTYIVEGEVYELPDKYMENSTLIEFAEAAQFEDSLKDLRNGHAIALLDVISVILRKPGEAYSEEVYYRNRETFKNVNLQQVAEINFFLLKQSARFGGVFLNYQAQAAAARVTRALVN